MTGTVTVGSDGKRRSMYVLADRRQNVNAAALRPRLIFQLMQDRKTVAFYFINCKYVYTK